MDYKNLVRDYIKKSGLSLSTIATRLSDYGIGVGKSYLSQLQNGKTGPASDEFNRALSSITGGDLDVLLAAAMVAKAPPELRDKAKRLLELIKLKNKYEEASQTVMLAQERVEAAEIRARQAQSDLDAINRLKDADLFPLACPVLSEVRCDISLTDNVVDGWEYVTTQGLNTWELLLFVQNDDSMAGSRILKSDKLQVRVQQIVQDGQIALVSVQGSPAIVRRVKCLDGNFLLLPENPNYEPLLVKAEQLRVIGVVEKVFFDISRGE